MSVLFVGASSQRIENTSPLLTGYPCSVGYWLWPNSLSGIDMHFSITNTASISYIATATDGSSRLTTFANGFDGPITGALATGAWHYVLARFISATSRRISVLRPTGEVGHGQGTTSVTPSGVNKNIIGCLHHSGSTIESFTDGKIAELWYTNTDVQADGAQTQEALIRQLAYGGPFSIPDVAKNVIEYKSFRVHPESIGDVQGEVYSGPYVRQIWTQTNSPTITDHPPLPYWYVRPNQVQINLTV